MESKLIHHRTRAFGVIAGIVTVSLTALLSGCGNKTDDSAAQGANTPPAATSATSTNVPASANQAGQGAQSMGDQRGQQAAANAAAFKAARDKAEGKR